MSSHPAPDPGDLVQQWIQEAQIIANIRRHDMNVLTMAQIHARDPREEHPISGDQITITQPTPEGEPT